MKLSLTRKAIALIAIPFLLQLFFLYAFANLLSHSERLADEDHRGRDLIGHCNWATTQLSLAIANYLIYQHTSDEQDRTNYTNCKNGFRDELRALTPIFQSADQKRLIALAQNIADDMLGELDKLVGPPDSHAVLAGAEQTKKLERDWARLSAVRHTLLFEDATHLGPDPLWLKDTRTLQKNVLSLAVVFDILAAAALIYWFTRHISNRLGVLASNTERLVQRLPLIEPLTGSDEVAELERNFHKMARQLKAAEQFRQDYVSMLSHDIRTPLNSVLGALELLEQTAQSGSDDGQLIGQANRGMNKALKLINQLLEVERIESGAYTPDYHEVPLEDVLLKAKQTLEGSAGAKQIAITIHPTDVLCDLDPTAMERVFENLFSNAIKFSGAKTEIAVSVSEIAQRIVIRVADQGRGVPQDQVESMFDRYKQVDPSDSKDMRGSGLGLAICKAFVEAHQGTISAKSEVGKGTTIEIELPRKRIRSATS